MLGKIIEAEENHIEFTIHLDQPGNFKLGQEVTINPAKKIRSLNQNRLYWAYLTWVISADGGRLIDQGHFSPDALHKNIKAWFIDKYPHQFNSKQITKFTTTELNTKEFNDYLDIVDRELMVKFFEIPTNRFWGERERPEVPF
jgi:hypothetical protein